MPFSRPTLSTIVSRIKNDLEASISGASTLLRRSVLSIIAKIVGGAVHLVYGFLDYESKNLFATFADEQGLSDIGNEYGVPRKAATAATGNAEVTGTNGLTVGVGAELQSDSGNIYVVDSTVTIVGGVATLALTSQIEEEDANDDPSIVLTFVSPIDGIDSTATVDSNGLEGGADIENSEDWRQRILSRRRLPPHGGAEFDYEAWALEVAGNTRAWSFSLYNGLGTVGLAFVRDDESPIIPSAAEIAVTEAYIVEHEDPATGKIVGIPVTAQNGLFMLTLVGLSVNVSVGIYPNNATVQAAITTELNNIIENRGGPGQTLYLSDLQEAISNAANLDRFRINSPVADIAATQLQVHVSGTFTYTTY